MTLSFYRRHLFHKQLTVLAILRKKHHLRHQLKHTGVVTIKVTCLQAVIRFALETIFVEFL